MKNKLILSLGVLVATILCSCNENGNLSNSSSFSSDILSNNITSNTEIISYTISFVTNSTRIIEPLKYEVGQNVLLEDLPILEDRNDLNAPKFVCWTLNGKDIINSFNMPNNDIELIAKYRPYESLTIKYETNIAEYNIDDTIIYENQDLNSYNFPEFDYPYKKLVNWFYDSSLTTKVNEKLDVTKFINNEITLYASIIDTNLSSSSWSNDGTKYVGKGYVQVKDTVNFSSNKTTKVTVELPPYDKTTLPYGTTEIYFGGDDNLIIDGMVKSGYALFICGLDDNSNSVNGNDDPRAGSMALYKYNKTTNKREMIGACRRYVEPLLSSSYYTSYKNYMETKNEPMKFDIEFVIGKDKSYILVEGSQLLSFDYQPDGNGFGFYTTATYPTAVSFESFITTESKKTTIIFDKDGGQGQADSIEVSYGSKIDNLPTLTKDNASFIGWSLNNSIINEDYIPGLVDSITLKATYGTTRNVWDGTIASNIANGTGSQIDPYIINTCSELAFLSKQINDKNDTYNQAYYKLNNNLDLSNLAWTPIGLINYPFKGTFDGNGKKIIGLKVDAAGSTGLFGHIADAYLLNIDVSASITSTNANSGILVGRCQPSTIKNCITRGTLSSTASYTGAICATIQPYYTGVSGTQTTMLIENCTNYASVESSATNSTLIGGILAQDSDSVVTEVNGCVNKGTITGGANFVGGIIGLVRKNENSIIKNCYNYGNISSTAKSRYTGGIAGVNRGRIENCYGCQDAKVNNILGSNDNAKLYPTSKGTNVPAAIICGHWDSEANCTTNSGFINCYMCDSEGNIVTK